MSATYGVQQGEEHCTQGSYREIWRKKDHMEYLGTDVRRLKRILQKQDGGCGPESSISR